MKKQKNKNTDLRTEAEIEFGKCLPQHLKTIFYGKILENLRERERKAFGSDYEKCLKKQSQFSLCGMKKQDTNAIQQSFLIETR